MEWLGDLAVIAAYAFGQLVFFLFLGLPFHVITYVVWRLTESRARIARTVLVAIPLAAGLAPCIEPGPLPSVYPIYLRMLPTPRGYAASELFVAGVTYGITLIAVFGSIAWLTRSRKLVRSRKRKA